MFSLSVFSTVSLLLPWMVSYVLGFGARGDHVILWQWASGAFMNAGPCSVHCSPALSWGSSSVWLTGVCWRVAGSMWPLERSCWYPHLMVVGPAFCLPSSGSMLCGPCFQPQLPPALPTLLCALSQGPTGPRPIPYWQVLRRLLRSVTLAAALSCWWHAGWDTGTNAKLLYPSNYPRENRSLAVVLLDLPRC